jgi:predicted aspartyl protease
MVTALGLIPRTIGTAILADGSVRNFDICTAEVLWDGSWLQVLVSAIGNECLIGMQMLAGQKLVIEVVPGGLVEIAPIP